MSETQLAQVSRSSLRLQRSTLESRICLGTLIKRAVHGAAPSIEEIAKSALESLLTDEQEAHENLTNLEMLDAVVAEAVLRYLYTFDYADGAGNTQGRVEALVLDVHMYIAADYLRLDDLEQLAASKFNDRAANKMHEDEFAEAVSVVYTSAPDHERLLRDSIVRICTQHAKKLFGAKENNLRLKELLATIPAFGGEVATKLAASSG